jgi:hypothetical protein
MKALTICQPYAELIARGSKRVENRTWPTRYRGTLLIHAGRSRDMLVLDQWNAAVDARYSLPLKDLRFGCIVAQARLIDCVRYDDAGVWRKFPWLHEHQHASGPWCWILEDVQRWDTPIEWRGAQGLFEVPDAELATAQAAARTRPVPLNHAFFGDDSE